MKPVTWSETTAIFGGAFDPPHLGHREVVEGLLREPGVKKIIILPSGNPPLKVTGTAAHHRLAMTELNFSNLREGLSLRVEIDEREIQRDSSRPSYTFDTLMELRRDLGGAIAFVVGVDQIESLERWYRVQDLLGLCHWIAIERESDGETDSAGRMLRGLRRLQALGLIRSTANPREWETLGGTRLLSVPTPARATSSTEIRRRFARGISRGSQMSPEIIGQNGSESLPGPVTENLHADVESYLKAHHLYGT